MWLWQLIKVFLRLFGFKANPNEIPYSWVLLGCVVLIDLVAKCFANLLQIDVINAYDTKSVINLSVIDSLLAVSLCMLILVAFVRTVLVHYKVTERFVQMLTALISVDVLATLLFMMWTFGLSFMQLPLEPDSVMALVLIVFFIMVLYWQFMVYMHIFLHSLTISTLLSGLFALVYMLLQQNIADILLNLLIKRNN